MLVSVVIPCYYSEKMIGQVVDQTRAELIKGGYDFEFVLVNDGSTDGTFAEITKLCEQDSRIVGLNCGKNLGQHSAIMAGLRHTQGDVILLMDDDMQTHPSQVHKLLDEIATTDADVVFATWPEQKQVWWRRAGSKFANWSIRWLTKCPQECYASNFLVMRSFIKDEITRYTGPYVYIQGLLFRATSNMRSIEIEHFERMQGESGYTFKALVRLWSTVLNFSTVPLRCATYLGSFMGLVGLIGAIAVVVNKIIDPTLNEGWPSLMAVLLICSGLVLLFMGLVGEYVGRLFTTANNAPQFVIKQTIDNRLPKSGDD